MSNLDISLLCARFPNSVTAAFTQGTFFEQTGKCNDAVRSYKRALALSRNLHLESFKALGRIYAYQTFDMTSAILCFRHAVQLEPRNAHNQLMLGLALSSLGKVHESLQSFYAGLRLQPDPEVELELLFNVALVHHDLGSSDAINSYKKVITFAGSNLNKVENAGILRCQAQMQCANIYSDRKLFKKALEMLESVDMNTADESTMNTICQTIEFIKRELEMS